MIKPLLKPTKQKKKPKRLKRKSLQPIPTLMRKAVEVFNRWIRNRDAIRLNGKCYTCGNPGSEAGHYVQSIGAMRFSEMGCNLQCTRCNRYLSGNQADYTIRLIQDYGLEATLELRKLKNQYVKHTRQSLEEIIKKYGDHEPPRP